MSIDAFIEKLKVIQNDILDFIDDINEEQDILQKLKDYDITKNQNELTLILYFIVNICNNHQRLGSFFSRIEKILNYYKTDILKSYTNYEIFHIFRSNKRILLFLIENKILNLDSKIIQIMSLKKYKYQQYLSYFYPEINKKEIDLNNFNKNRQKGENDNYICQLIQNDSIIEFIQYINKTNTPLTAQIKATTFETNLFLLKKSPNLIEYSSFYGSFQIFQYLFFNNVQIESTIWPYVIHGRNAQIIHYLEENGIEPNIKCIKESIKCHHNEIAEYFITNYSNISTDENSYVYSSIKYYNFNYFPKSLQDDILFYYLCGYDYYFIVEKIMNTERINYMKKTDYKSLYEYFPKPLYLTSINAAAKNMNLNILCLLLKQKNVNIGCFCFYKCRELESIQIPSSVTSIGKQEFMKCSLLKEIIIPSSVVSIGHLAFCKCTSLTQITIPSSVTSIEDGAFYECTSLKQITIPSSVTKIEDFVFYGCSSLEQVLIQSYESSSLKTESSYSSIGECAFYGCSSLKQIPIPLFFDSIKIYSFAHCSSLTQVTIPSSVINIKCKAFAKCSSLKEIIFDDQSSVKSFGEYVFFGCSSLTKISIPSSLERIERGCFSGCTSLHNISIPSSVTFIGCFAFNGCSSLADVCLSSSLERIKNCTFKNCKSLRKIIIPSSVNEIESFAFFNCQALSEAIILPSNANIEYFAFPSQTLVVQFMTETREVKENLMIKELLMNLYDLFQYF